MSAKKTKEKKCGIIMPISSIDGCNELHWEEVKSIIFDAIEAADFIPNLVSDSDDIGIIQKNIIQNLYDNPMVICDVSAKNPNVMFELGMRLAFDKPTIIIKDDKTSYSFDTSPIQHIEYPRDLRFAKILEFKRELKDKLENTYKTSKDDPSYTTFLKHFGRFVVAKLDETEISSQELILTEIMEMKKAFYNFTQKNYSMKAVRSYEPSVKGDLEKKIPNIILYHYTKLNLGKSSKFIDYKKKIRNLVEIETNAERYFTSRKEWEDFFEELYDSVELELNTIKENIK